MMTCVPSRSNTSSLEEDFPRDKVQIEALRWPSVSLQERCCVVIVESFSPEYFRQFLKKISSREVYSLLLDCALYLNSSSKLEDLLALWRWKVCAVGRRSLFPELGSCGTLENVRLNQIISAFMNAVKSGQLHQHHVRIETLDLCAMKARSLNAETFRVDDDNDIQIDYGIDTNMVLEKKTLIKDIISSVVTCFRRRINRPEGVDDFDRSAVVAAAAQQNYYEAEEEDYYEDDGALTNNYEFLDEDNLETRRKYKILIFNSGNVYSTHGVYPLASKKILPVGNHGVVEVQPYILKLHVFFRRWERGKKINPEILISALRDVTSVHLTIVGATVEQLCEFLLFFGDVTSLHLAKCNIMGCLGSVLSCCRGTERHLCLENCNLTSQDIEALLAGKNVNRVTKLLEINFPVGAVEHYLALISASSDTIQELDLTGCVINEEMLPVLVEAMLKCRELECVYVILAEVYVPTDRKCVFARIGSLPRLGKVLVNFGASYEHMCDLERKLNRFRTHVGTDLEEIKVRCYARNEWDRTNNEIGPLCRASHPWGLKCSEQVLMREIYRYGCD